MIVLNTEIIIALHDMQIERFGGEYGVRDVGLLESLTVSPYQTFDGKDLYPDVYDKALKYLYGFAQSQAFADGNKRTAAIVMLVFLEYNGISVRFSNDELYDLTMDVANDRLSQTEAKAFLMSRILKD